MKIERFVFNPFEVNTYLIYDDSSNAVLIDPGFSNEREFHFFTNFLEEKKLKISRVLNTHLHIDHCVGNTFIERHFGLLSEASEKDLFLLERAKNQAILFGFPFSGELPLLGAYLNEGDCISVGSFSLRVLEVPGHSPGGLSFFEEKERVLFSGDTLFEGTRGRSDLPGGSDDELLQSIREKLLTLPQDTCVLSGHGEKTTIGRERAWY